MSVVLCFENLTICLLMLCEMVWIIVILIVDKIAILTLGQARSQGGTKGCRALPNKNPVHPQINPVHPQINPFWPHFCPFSVICGSFAPPKVFLWLRACLGDMLHETYWENPMRIEAGLSIRSLQLHSRPWHTPQLLWCGHSL